MAMQPDELAEKKLHELVEIARQGSGLTIRGRTAEGYPFSVLVMVAKPGMEQAVYGVHALVEALAKSGGKPNFLVTPQHDLGCAECTAYGVLCPRHRGSAS